MKKLTKKYIRKIHHFMTHHKIYFHNINLSKSYLKAIYEITAYDILIKRADKSVHPLMIDSNTYNIMVCTHLHDRATYSKIPAHEANLIVTQIFKHIQEHISNFREIFTKI